RSTAQEAKTRRGRADVCALRPLELRARREEKTRAVSEFAPCRRKPARLDARPAFQAYRVECLCIQGNDSPSLEGARLVSCRARSGDCPGGAGRTKNSLRIRLR